MAISPLELRHIVESGFLPLQCRCTTDAQGGLTIELVDPSTGHNLVVGGLTLAELDSSRAIANLIAALKTQLLNDPRTKNTA